jgi:hypothetical protein
MVTIKLGRQKSVTSVVPKIWEKLVRRFQQDLNCIIQNPAFFLMRKAARLEIVRDVVCALSQPAVHSYNITASCPSIFENLDVHTIASTLQQEGFCPGLQLPPSVVQDVLHYAETHSCWGDRDARFEFLPHQKAEAEAQFSQSFRLASYTGTNAVLNQIIHDPGLLAIAAQYFGTDPVLVGSELLWSFPVPSTSTQRMKAAQVMHYDIDDYRCLKFFFYLTDVDEGSGPHACIPRTHRGKKWLHQVLGQRCAKIDDEKLIADYGGKIVTLCGAPGFGFVEDPFCFHRGNPVERKPRLMLQVEYAANAYGDIRSYYEQASTRMAAPA